MKEELKRIKEGLEKEGFRIIHQLGKQRYSISKVGNPLERLCLNKEGLLDRGVDGVISEYNKMISSFREREAFLDNFLTQIEGKTVKELTYKEFATIIDKDIPHDGVSNAYKKYWDSLTHIEKRRVRNDYDGVAEYVYFLVQIEGKSIKELTYKEFEMIIDKEISHDGVSNAYKKYWDSLTDTEQRSIRKNGYDEITKYVYSKVVSE